MSPSRDGAVGAIRAQHLWKRYRTRARRPLLRDLLTPRRRRGGNPWNWVLRDVDLTIAPGESVGLVGLNGSGKSTLLKLLTGVTFPNAGRLAAHGRIGALIEVRAGIHPDLTGRENIYFYGTVLGLSRREVRQRFHDMVDFAELADAVDRQVKFYSSGMQMRLGFAVAAFLEPDILLVDEALAVGDVGFQQRCLERMRQVLVQGTTLVFVSHDMAAVESMCARTLWLDDGVVRSDAPTGETLAAYRVGLEEKAGRLAELLDDPVRCGPPVLSGSGSGPPRTGEELTVRLELESQHACDVQLCVGVSEGPAAPIFTLTRTVALRPGHNTVRCLVDSLPLPRGRYYLWVGGFGPGGTSLLRWHPAAPLDVEGPMRQPPPRGVMLLSPVHVTAHWDVATDEVAVPIARAAGAGGSWPRHRKPQG
jgi:ABC-type polysaccharide/polyol phosphate transport system ATPase subunit